MPGIMKENAVNRKSNKAAVRGAAGQNVKPAGIVIFESGMVPDKPDYDKQLTNALTGAFNMLPPINSGRAVWEVMLGNALSVVIVSQTLRDTDAANLINLLRLSDYCSETMFFLCVKKLNKSVCSVCGEQNLDGVFSYSAPLDKTADEIAEKYYSRIDELRQRNFEKLTEKYGDASLLFDIERGRMSFDSMLSDILLPLGLSKAHKGAEYACLILVMKLMNIDKPLSALYELAALYFNTTAAAVEKSLRYALERAWTVGNICMQQIIFGNTVDESKGKPTNSEFIARIYEYIKETVKYRIARPK